MKKYALDLIVAAVETPRDGYVLLRLTHDETLPEMLPGQFVEVQVRGSETTFLRRPISINYVDRVNNELWLLVHVVGEGTRAMAALKAGDTLNCVFPLGNGFTVPAGSGKKVLLVGGGVGTAPLLYHGEMLRAAGHCPVFLLGGRTEADLMQLDHFRRYGEVLLTTEDGSAGTKGFVTHHPVWEEQSFDLVATCGPKPMMVAVARMAKAKGTECEVSLENLMACGLGACLCCVEKTQKGNVCVCKDGPVFNINQLTWQI
ncbi:MAG: dihydroorotate dehydrogenase electron transfer subunit [Bacteroidaceae bacterium]|nr:dihydroorotate dehydrogenase electron transfer subunit [Bacteroidaceae bacterium]